MSAPGRPRIYLAGPEVFLPEAREIGVTKAALCAEAGFEGVFPLDQSLDLRGKTKLEQATLIQEADEGLMHSCALAIANLTPFRGVAMDSGTAYEVGFMRALGRPVLGYTNIPGEYAARARAWRIAAIGLPDADRPDAEIEDFGLTENLMIAIAIRASGGLVAEHAAPPGAEMTDLTAFKTCLAQAQRLNAKRS